MDKEKLINKFDSNSRVFSIVSIAASVLFLIICIILIATQNLYKNISVDAQIFVIPANIVFKALSLLILNIVFNLLIVKFNIVILDVIYIVLFICITFISDRVLVLFNSSSINVATNSSFIISIVNLFSPLILFSIVAYFISSILKYTINHIKTL